MSRTFTQNSDTQYLGLGAGGIGNLIHGQGAISFHCWAKPSAIATGAANENRILSAYMTLSATTNVICNINNTAGNKLRVGARSQNGDSFQSANSLTEITTGLWWSAGFVLDYANDQIRIYINGTLETTANVTFGSSTYSHPSNSSLEDSYSDQIAGASSDLRFAGDLAEGAIWAGDIGDANFALLAGGDLADTIGGFTLLSYIPITGTDDPEPDNGTPGLTTTLFGSPAQGSEPPIDTAGVITPANLSQAQTLEAVSLTGESLAIESALEGENIDLTNSSVSDAATLTPTVTFVPYRQLNETDATVNPEWWSWYGRITAADGRTPVFKLPRAFYYQTQPPSSYRPVYSEDGGATWSAFDNFTSNDGAGNWEFSNNAAFTQAEVHFAYARPYSLGTELVDWLTNVVLPSPYVEGLGDGGGISFAQTLAQTAPDGRAIDPQPLFGFRLTDDSQQPDDGNAKRHAVLSAGVHPSEDIGNEMLEGAVDFLLSADAVAQRLRKNFVWFVYPMINPAGRYGRAVRGSFETGQCGGVDRDYMDPNRHLGDGCLHHNASWEIGFAAHTAGQIDVYLDYHGFVTPKFDHWYNADIPGSVDYHAALQAYIPTIGENTSSIPTNNRNYIHNTYGARVSDTLEMGFHENPTIADTVTLGEASVKAVDDLFTAGLFDYLAPDNLAQAQTLEAATLTPATVSVLPAALSQAQTLEAAALTEHGSLAPADLEQAQSIDAAALTQHSAVIVDALSQAQSLGGVTLAVAGALSVNGLSQGQAIDVVALTQHSALAVADLSQEQTLQTASVTPAGAPTLLVASLSQAQNIDPAVLAQHNVLVVEDLTQQQLIGGVSFDAAVGWLQGEVYIVAAIQGKVTIN